MTDDATSSTSDIADAPAAELAWLVAAPLADTPEAFAEVLNMSQCLYHISF